VAAALLVAATVPAMNAHENAILQSRIPPGLQGRFFAIDRVIGQVTWPLGTALWGWAAGMGNPAAILAGWGCLSTLFFISQFFNPRMLSVETIQISESK